MRLVNLCICRIQTKSYNGFNGYVSYKKNWKIEPYSKLFKNMKCFMRGTII